MIRDLKELLQPGPFADLELAMVGSGYGPTDIRRMSELGMTIEEIKTVLKRAKMEKTSNTTFRDIAGRIADLQEKKNESYGNAFGQSCDKYGVVSALTRLNDKLNRLDSLYKSSEQSAFGESFTDTLTDLAAYAMMTIEWIENGQSSRMESAGTGSAASAE